MNQHFIAIQDIYKLNAYIQLFFFISPEVASVIL